jgi:hypothetical protein
MNDRDHAVTPEPFVSAQEAAQFLSINRRLLLSLARKGIAGAYSLGTGNLRRIWVFRLSELGNAIDHQHKRPFSTPKDHKRGYDPDQGSPR